MKISYKIIFKFKIMTEAGQNNEGNINLHNFMKLIFNE